VDDLNDLREDETNSNDDETEGTAVEDFPDASALEKHAEPDELEDGAVAPEQYEDAVDESGLAEAQLAASVEEEEDEFASETVPSTSAPPNGEANPDGAFTVHSRTMWA
jgi:hypothetical protein